MRAPHPEDEMYSAARISTNLQRCWAFPFSEKLSAGEPSTRSDMTARKDAEKHPGGRACDRLPSQSASAR